MSLVWSPGFNGVTDPDAQTYIAAVEAADGQAIEGNVAYAINDFVVGCKLDGIWDAIKASCILAGARTLSGALVPLKGTAPTNYNFVAADYNRETGLVGDGTSKRLDSNRANNADPQGSNHNVVWLSNYTSGYQYLMGDSGLSSWSGNNFLSAGNSEAVFRNRFDGGTDARPSATGSEFSGGIFGCSRTSTTSVDYAYRQSAGIVFGTATVGSLPPTAYNTSIFHFYSAPYSNCRLSFYSIGEAIDLEKLDTRLTRLMNLLSYSLASGLPALSSMDIDAALYIGAIYRAGGTLS